MVRLPARDAGQRVQRARGVVVSALLRECEQLRSHLVCACMAHNDGESALKDSDSARGQREQAGEGVVSRVHACSVSVFDRKATQDMLHGEKLKAMKA